MLAAMGASLESVGIGIDFGFFKLDTEWKEDPAQRNAAWAMYVELVTRVSIQTLDVDDGILREALDSLYALFAVTRDVLREDGPKVGASKDTVGGIALIVLNQVLRPFLTKWHRRLTEHEKTNKPEREWEHEMACRAELERLRGGLVTYANTLRKISGAA